MDSGKHPLRSRLLLRLGIFLLLPVLLLFVPAGAAETTPPKTAACWFDDLTYDIQTNTHPKPTRLQVSPNGRFLQYADGRPFFYLADTAWMLPNKLTEEEARRLFADRSAKGFTVIQSLIFRDLFVPNSANVHGVKPFASEADMYAAKLNPKWLDWVVRITKMAAEHGLVMAWLPTWGDKWTKRNNSAGPVIFDKDSKAEAYGRDLSEAMKECDNVIWVLGGDSDIETPAQADIMRAMARGLRSGAKRGRLITFHPGGGKTAAIFSSEDWLDINTVQSGHGRLNNPNYRQIETLYNTLPTKPCLDIESNYERMPVGVKRQNGIAPERRAFFDDYDVRRSYYRSVLAGAAGFAYGCDPIRQIYRPATAAMPGTDRASKRGRRGWRPRVPHNCSSSSGCCWSAATSHAYRTRDFYENSKKAATMIPSLISQSPAAAPAATLWCMCRSGRCSPSTPRCCRPNGCLSPNTILKPACNFILGRSRTAGSTATFRRGDSTPCW